MEYTIHGNIYTLIEENETYFIMFDEQQKIERKFPKFKQQYKLNGDIISTNKSDFLSKKDII